MIELKTPSGARQVGAVLLRTATGTRVVASISLRTTTATRTLYTIAAAIKVSPSEADGYISSKGTVPAPTSQITVSGFTGSPTIAWSVPSGWSVSSQGNATTSFRSPPIAPGTDISASGTVTVTPGGSATFDLYASNQGFGG